MEEVAVKKRGRPAKMPGGGNLQQRRWQQLRQASKARSSRQEQGPQWRRWTAGSPTQGVQNPK
ncbi:GD20814 [Drosophila simulans]|uniref:GD20814 n=1 Tax=Drosophila simulans TaxID=7240 RepID=B4QX93_DROSI|nr:GD20814 [Drosophila simulans]